MTLPQKLGLDVVVDQHTGNLVTLEINGIFSGYQGLKALGTDLTPQIMDIIGNHCHNHKILINPYVHEFYGDPENINDLKNFKNFFNIDLVYSPITKTITQKDLEAICGPLDEFAAVIGFGDYLKKSNCHSRMINSPAVELLTCNKFIQYKLLKDIPNLNMPETMLIDKFVNIDMMTAMVQQHGKIVHKPIDGGQGEGIMILTENNIHRYKKYLEKFISPMPKQLKLIFYIRCLQQLETKLEQELEIKSYSHAEGLDKEERRKKYNDAIQQRFEKKAVVLQKYIETLPLIFEDTGQPHYACARLLWFGSYCGGYWRLSSEPIDSTNEMNAIVNYSRTHIAQRFTPEEEDIFRTYAQDIVPKILQKAASFELLTENYEAITFQEYKKSLFLIYNKGL